MARTIRSQEIFPIATRELRVIRAVDVTPGMRRVTLGGAQLEAFTSANGFKVEPFRNEGFDDEFKLFFTHPSLEKPLVPEQAEGVLHWPRVPELIARTYTVRRFDPAAGEVEVDFVRHGLGPATAWAYRCQPGDTLHIAGPKQSRQPPAGVDWLLIAGDETALPAIGRWLEEMPAGTRAKVFIEIADHSRRQRFSTDADADITWLVRDGAESGTTTLLYDAVTQSEWLPGDVYAWVAGEALTLVPIRRWLRNVRQLPKENTEVVGYWRRSDVKPSEADPALPDPDTVRPSSAERLHELVGLLPPMALRVAVTLGIPDLLESGPATTAALAAGTGADATAVGRLAHYLSTLEVLKQVGGNRWKLTDIGLELLHERVAEALHLDGLTAARDRALGGLLEAVQTAASPYERMFGASLAETIERDDRLRQEAVDSGLMQAGWTAPALARGSFLEGLRSLYVHGTGAGEFARQLVDAWPAAHLTVLTTPSIAEVTEEKIGSHARIAYEHGSAMDRRSRPADAFLLVNALTGLPDRDAVHVLAQSAASLAPGGTLLVLEKPLDLGDVTEHDLEKDLMQLVTTGGRLRTVDALTELLDTAAIGHTERHSVGWGSALFVVRPH